MVRAVFGKGCWQLLVATTCTVSGSDIQNNYQQFESDMTKNRADIGLR